MSSERLEPLPLRVSIDVSARLDRLAEAFSIPGTPGTRAGAARACLLRGLDAYEGERGMDAAPALPTAPVDPPPDESTASAAPPELPATEPAEDVSAPIAPELASPPATVTVVDSYYAPRITPEAPPVTVATSGYVATVPTQSYARPAIMRDVRLVDKDGQPIAEDALDAFLEDLVRRSPGIASAFLESLVPRDQSVASTHPVSGADRLFPTPRPDDPTPRALQLPSTRAASKKPAHKPKKRSRR